MQDLNVTLVQAEQTWEDKQANFKHFESILSNFKHKTDLIILPEMFHTGFTMNAESLAEAMNGNGVSWLKTQAKQHNAAFVASLIIKEAGRFYNRMVFVTPKGEVSIYDKRKLFGMAKEDEHYTAGQKNTIVNYKGWKILLQVCYDLRFPEIARNKINESSEPIYDALIYVANWPEKRNQHWKTLLRARAIENQCYVLAVNRVGEDKNKLTYSGDSSVIDPLGKILDTATHSEKILISDLSFSTLQTVREKLPFLKDIE